MTETVERPVPEAGPAGAPVRPPAGPDLGPEPDVEPALEAELDLAEATERPADAVEPRREGRLRRILHRPRTRRGFFALLLVVAGFAAVAAFGTMTAVAWTETSDFCGRCHQMGPELAAYQAGPHRDVPCAECHVSPGIGGWVNAKIKGTKQLVQVLTGLYPKPVPPPDHADLPPTSDTCLRCHALGSLATTTVLTRTEFSTDEANSRQFVGLMVRPGGGDPTNLQRSVHWHVLQDVEYGSAEANAHKIDWVRITRSDGTVEQFIASDQITTSDDATPDLQHLQATERARRMDCLDCHNRVGHPIPNPRLAVDQAMVDGKISPSLPYIKQQAMDILVGDYPSVQAADAAADSLRDYYQLHYPLVATQQAAAIDSTVAQVKLIYRLAATPEMKVTAKTYADNLGHTDSPGCFRCHDGAHFLVRDGQVTKESIPFKCDTCHTFPQIGAVASLPLGEAPTTHADGLWVFDHKKVATSADPGGTTCGQCHAKDYCVNCHRTGAVNVTHDDMLVNHAKVTQQAGAAACAYCHQPAYCARCHAQPVLPGGNEPQPSATTGLAWPLITARAGT
ncbi:MAG TPA: NapC/NirT family cytochrome c [Candidatus Limnocylindrales bacterium]